MPDITMCDSTVCKHRETCRRNKASGTVPNEYRQAYFVGSETLTFDECDHYLQAWGVK